MASLSLYGHPFLYKGHIFLPMRKFGPIFKVGTRVDSFPVYIIIRFETCCFSPSSILFGCPLPPFFPTEYRPWSAPCVTVLAGTARLQAILSIPAACIQHLYWSNRHHCTYNTWHLCFVHIYKGNTENRRTSLLNLYLFIYLFAYFLYSYKWRSCTQRKLLTLSHMHKYTPTPALPSPNFNYRELGFWLCS